MKEYGVLYLKPVFPEGHKKQWLNYVKIGVGIPKELSSILDGFVERTNKKFKDYIHLKLDKGLQPGLLCDADRVEEIARFIYNGYCDAFDAANIKPYLRLVYTTGTIDEKYINEVDTVHHLPPLPVMVKLGRFLDSEKETGIFKI